MISCPNSGIFAQVEVGSQQLVSGCQLVHLCSISYTKNISVLVLTSLGLFPHGKSLELVNS